jgi:hypothetical protein
MNTKHVIASVAVASALSFSATANAAEPTPAKDTAGSSDDASPRLPAADRSVELTVATGYAQGFGDVATGQPSLTDVGQAGGAVQVGVGYRLVPRLTLGLYGSGATFARGDRADGSSNLYSATAGAQADWHFIPSGSQIDPWVSLGTGWRGYWVHADQGTTSIQGLELAKAQVGVDFRVAPQVALSPVVGADMSLFLTESTPGTRFANLTNPNVNTFLFAGVQGRFDIPTGTPESREVASR